MAGGRKTINRRFELYAETLLDDYKCIRVVVIVVHLLSLLLGMAALIIGVFAYTTSNDLNGLLSLNCTLSLQLQPPSGPEFPVQLQLILTGIGLIALDIAMSMLLCILKKTICGTLAILWFLVSTMFVTVWSVWSVLYIVLVYPEWEADRTSCNGVVVISAVVGCALMLFFMVMYWVIIAVTTIYDCWYRCDLECVCSCNKRNTDFGSYDY